MKPEPSVLAESLENWLPGQEVMTRRVDSWPAAAFADLIGVPPPPLEPGDPLPPMWHWFTLIGHPAQSELGADGHPASGPLLPPIPGRRRMFAGGRLRQDAPIPVDGELSGRSSVSAVSVKHGRSGEMAFVTVRHELTADGAMAGVEEQDIVYRSEPEGERHRIVPRPETGIPEPEGSLRIALKPCPTLLFRFSALTYNGHRIHYDWQYATKAEGYPDLVVHGPLLALLTLELPRLYAPDRAVRAFSYRLAQPAFLPSRIVCAAQSGKDTFDVAVAAEGAAPSLTAKIILG